ncbi:MAG: nucleoside deaminase [Deltaproteobacteria bacterium]|jgi:tRNA(Arg) A34 adenosine deaminase TadA|nr:nucleoside deaminase [Deltaproteobacteria bacterium]
MTQLSDLEYFNKAIQLSQQALDSGNEPFGALLVGPDGKILLEQQNQVGKLKDHTAHDVFLVASRASKEFDQAFLWECTVYSTVEPCLMCLGGVFWANIGNIKYIIKENDLNKMFGGDPLITIHSDHIMPKLAKNIKITGPFLEVESKAKAVVSAWLS